MGALVVAQQGTTTQSKNPLPSSFVIIVVSIFLINYDDHWQEDLKVRILLQPIIAIMVVTPSPSIFIVIVMITKEEVCTASMTRQSDTPSFFTRPTPQQPELKMDKFHV